MKRVHWVDHGEHFLSLSMSVSHGEIMVKSCKIQYLMFLLFSHVSLFFCWTYLSHLCQTIKPLKNYHQLSVRNMSGNGAVYDTVSISSYNFDVWLWNFMRIRPLQEVTTLKTCHETQSRLVTLG